jgi:hypothetical protein
MVAASQVPGDLLGRPLDTQLLCDQPAQRLVPGQQTQLRPARLVALGLVLALAVIEFVGQEPEPPAHGVATAGRRPRVMACCVRVGGVAGSGW